jgi:GTP cyclohydrolase II
VVYKGHPKEAIIRKWAGSSFCQFGGRVVEIKTILDAEGGMGRIAVDRALAEVRAGRPVIIKAGRSHLLMLCVEALDERHVASLEALGKHRARLLLPAPRLRRMGQDRVKSGAIALPTIDLKRIETLALEVGARIDAPVATLGRLDQAALELASLALVLPAVVALPVSVRDIEGEGLVRVEVSAIEAYRRARVAELHIVGRAPVPLEGAPESEFVIFRGGEGLRDQVAIVVGKPDLGEPVTVRLHSACLTGDLFGSLKCDCGDQLRHTAQFMAQNGGGILLYLDQEGRGNGLSNKMRAYKLQSQGFDTYDADEVLGFGHDQRGFDFAAEMLKQLGVTRVQVMTNNPVKIGALKEAGLEVVSDRRILGRKTDQNVRYLASKRDRAGHFIEVDEVPVPGSKDER